MNNEYILSLCVSVINHRGINLLYRVADVSEYNELLPFYVDMTLPREDENIETIFANPQEIQPEGTITFWRWYAESGNKQYSYLNSSIPWIECICIDGISTIEELRVALSSGIDIDISSDHDYLIVFSNNGDAVSQCVFCKPSDFVLFGDKYILRDNIYRLDYYEIPSSDIHDIRTTYLQELNKKYYGHLELPPKSDTILVRSATNTVKQAIQKRIQRCTEGFSKSDKKTISDFLKSLSDDSIVNHIADECRCTIDEAHKYINEFISTCERYLSEDDFLSAVMLHLVEYDSEVGKKYQKEVQDEWERLNTVRIDEANAEVDKINIELKETQNRLNELINECDEYEKMKIEAEEKAAELQKEYDDKLELADKINDIVREKIVAAKSDLSSFLSEYLIFTNDDALIPELPPSSFNIIKGKTISEEPDTLTNISEVFDCLKDNLSAVGIDKQYSSSLGAFFLAAYYERIPLIVAGYGADLIINAVGATLNNSEPDRITITDNLLNLEIVDSPMLAVNNGLYNMGSILKMANTSYLYFISQTSEELIIEPRSLYNYALPVFTEYFITELPNDELYGTISTLHLEGNKSRKPNFPDYIVPPLAFNNYRRLLGRTAEIYSDIPSYDIFLLTSLPIMLSQNKREELLDILSSSNMTDIEKANINRLIGERQ